MEIPGQFNHSIFLCLSYERFSVPFVFEFGCIFSVIENENANIKQGTMYYWTHGNDCSII